jgi:uncharacterized YigZ family protein
MIDYFYSIANPARIETKVKGSRFIGEAAIVKNVFEAKGQLEKIRKREYNATHHCSAWRVGIGQNIEFKYSDDGEPGGTAGKPIFDCIAGKELTNVMVVVTRYYGGTKLGSGGLVRSYSEAALLALEKAGKKTIYVTDRIRLIIDFSYYDQTLKLLEEFGIKQTLSDFAEKVSMEIEVRKSLTAQFERKITDITRGTAQIEEQDKD